LLWLEIKPRGTGDSYFWCAMVTVATRVCVMYGRPIIRMVMDVPGSFHGAAKISVDSVNP
jgi:hypothetical protein